VPNDECHFSGTAVTMVGAVKS